MAVGRSSDGGQTWTNTYFHEDTGSAQFNDKPMITVDNQPASPHQGTVYVAWDITPGGAGGKSAVTGVLVSNSTDQGRSFSNPVFASAINAGPVGDIGAAIPGMSSRRALLYPACGADGAGRLFCSWMEGTIASGVNVFVSQ